MSNYTDKCGSCARFDYCIVDGEIRMIGTCETRKKSIRTNLASAMKCDEYINRKRTKMTKAELNELVETIISIRDRYELCRSDRDALADACNIIYHNVEMLAEGETE